MNKPLTGLTAGSEWGGGEIIDPVNPAERERQPWKGNMLCLAAGLAPGLPSSFLLRSVACKPGVQIDVDGDNFVSDGLEHSKSDPVSSQTDIRRRPSALKQELSLKARD